MRSTLIKRAAGAIALSTVLALSGCGSDDSSNDATDGAGTSAGTSTETSPDAATTTGPDSETSPEPSSPAAETGKAPDIDVMVKGDDVTPKGDRIDVSVDKPITIHVTSDRAGELHVHSSPEQELEYGVGETDLTLTVKTPGIVDVEDHVSDTVIAQLEVR